MKLIKYSSSHLTVREGRDLSGESGQSRGVEVERRKKIICREESLFIICTLQSLELNKPSLVVSRALSAVSPPLVCCPVFVVLVHSVVLTSCKLLTSQFSDQIKNGKVESSR